MKRIVVGYFSVVQLKAIRNRGNSQSFWISNESAILRKSIMLKGMSTRGRIDPCPIPKQDHSQLSLLVHHPHTVLVTNTWNTRPPSNQFDPDLAASPSNPSSASTRHEPRSLNRERLSPIRGLRSVDHGPICLELGPRTTAHGCYPDCYPK